MAALLASHSCYCRDVESLNQGRYISESFSFSSSVSSSSFAVSKRQHDHTRSRSRFQVRMTQTESSPASKLGANGRPVKMVPVNEVVKRRTPNGSSSSSKVDLVNGKKKVINGAASIVKKSSSVVPVRRLADNKLPPLEGLKALPTDEGFSWADDNYNNVQRNIDIWSFFLAFRVRLTLDNAKWAYLGSFSEEKQKMRRKNTAVWLREQVLQLGPTFIKLGQLSSTRSDLFPKEFVDELAKLQDRVPAFPPSKARSFVERELGVPIDVLFREFEDRPIAAASLGQVHRAILHNGEKVVVKIQRPGLKKLFDIDLNNMKIVAGYLQKSDTFGGPTNDWVGIYEECATILYQEIDYINEGKNADRFRRDFRNIKWVRVPVFHLNHPINVKL